ncbi:MAG: hypothetical protein RLZZ444_2275 [Pseudomonadota bacterium]|jgi:uncharacterized metal-binding protein YceD (DUF177 family)
MSHTSDDVPFSHPVKVGTISHVPIELHIEANEAQRRRLARLWDIVSVEALTADLKIRRYKKDGVKVIGHVSAKVTQSCVVTLEPVEDVIEEEIDHILVPEGSALARVPANDEGEMVIDPEGPDLPDIFVGDSIDAGAIVAEFAALGLNPYPRRKDAAFSDHIETTAADDRKPSPFAVLKGLKVEK